MHNRPAIDRVSDENDDRRQDSPTRATLLAGGHIDWRALVPVMGSITGESRHMREGLARRAVCLGELHSHSLGVLCL